MAFLQLLFGFLVAFVLTKASENTAGSAASTNISGLSFGYYYTFSADDGDAVTFTNEEEGEYNIQWAENSGHFVGGVGWNPGSAQSIRYGAFDPAGDSYLSIYGWTTNPLVEYRILEQNFGGVDPTAGLTWKGNFSSDGSVYDIFEAQVVDAPSIVGIANFKQYWSIRQTLRSDGTVTTSNHFAAWAAAGMPLGAFGYQIVATEQVASESTQAGSVIVIAESPPAGPCAPEYAQCGGQGFTGPNCCVSNTTCVVDNRFFSTCVADSAL